MRIFAQRGSNLREAQNFGNHLVEEISSGLHDGCAVWAATDNAVWSAVWNKGLSTAKPLFWIVLDLRILCLKHKVFLDVFHVLGMRMIRTELDGRSRGDLDAGVSLGYDLREFLPLDEGPFEMSAGTLRPWLKYWLGN